MWLVLQLQQPTTMDIKRDLLSKTLWKPFTLKSAINAHILHADSAGVTPHHKPGYRLLLTHKSLNLAQLKSSARCTKRAATYCTVHPTHKEELAHAASLFSFSLLSKFIK